MRVLITGPALSDQGGVASYYNSVLPHLDARSDLTVHYLEIGSTRASRAAVSPLTDQLRFRSALEELRPDLVHVNPSLVVKSFLRDGLFVRRAKRRGYRVLVFFRGWDERFEAAVDARWRWFFRRTFGRADTSIVLASAFRDKLRDWGVRNPIELGTTAVSEKLIEQFSSTDKLTELATAPVMRVLFLARLVRDKGILETLDAIARLRAAGRPIALTVAGAGDAMREVRELVAAHDPAGEFLRVVGDVRGADKQRLLASHHVYCCPTYAEGMPNSVLEAMAFAMPVITCATGGLRDFFEDGRMGYFVRPRTATEVALALERLIADREACARMAAYNRDYAMRNFLAPSVADRLASVYRRLG